MSVLNINFKLQLSDLDAGSSWITTIYQSCIFPHCHIYQMSVLATFGKAQLAVFSLWYGCFFMED